ncbi:MAG: PAS domain-containing sensor histidine kinase [Promethearchaeota archaeon]|nr:MAG: PAS domain-containing sensor histidine kinase [Candidatus Lokiarchaeota archaeon]
MSISPNRVTDKAPNEILDAIFSTTPIGIKLCDAHGKLIKINRACLEILGTSDFKEIKDYDIFKDPNIPEEYLAKLKKGEPVKYETLYSFDLVKDLNLYKTSKKGEINIDVSIIPLFLDKPKSISNYLIQVENISERIRSKIRLKESEEKFRELFNNISSGVAIYEVVNGGKDFNFKDLNLAGEKIDNIQKENLIGKSLLKTFPTVKKFGLFKVFQRVWKTGKPEHHPSALYKDNRIEGWRENYVFKLSTGEIVAVYDDITERMTVLEKLKKSEENLRKLNEALEQKVQRRTNGSKGSESRYRNAYERSDFYKELFAHDIGNILQVINSSAEIIQHYFKSSEKSVDLAEILNMIKEQVMKGKKLISNVHKLSDLEEINLSLYKIDVIHFLEQAIILMQKIHRERDMDIKIKASDEKYYVFANEFLEDLFDNLLINAIKYNDNTRNEILIKISKAKKYNRNYIKMEFLDNGIGIEDQRKEIIFQRGNREIKGTKGMGLGLSLVKKIVENYKGQIWVEDKVKGDYSKGSNFVLMLPEAD